MTSIQIPSCYQPITDQSGVSTTSWFTYFQGIYKAIRSQQNLRLGGLLNINTATYANTNSGVTNLANFSLQSNTLVNTGDRLLIKGWGYFAGNSNNKTITLLFGGQTIYSSGAIAANGTSWSITAEIIRLSNTTQEIIVESLLNNTTSTTRTSGTQDLTSILTIQFTGQGSVTNDIIQTMMYEELTPND